MPRYIQGSLFDYVSSPKNNTSTSEGERSSADSSSISPEKKLVSNPLFTSNDTPVIPAIPVTNLPPEILPSISRNNTRKFKVGLKYGENIGGSHYDRFNFINEQDVLEVLKDMTTAEKSKIFNRDSLWPEPDWVKLADEGYDKHSLYRIKCIRQNISQKIPQFILSRKYFLEENLFIYTQMVMSLRDLCMENLNGLSNEKIIPFLEEKKDKEFKKYGYSWGKESGISVSDIVSLLQGKEETVPDFQFKELFIYSQMKLTTMYKALFLRTSLKENLLKISLKIDESLPYNTIGVVRQENWPHGPAPEWTNKYFVYSEDTGNPSDPDNGSYTIVNLAPHEEGKPRLEKCILTDDKNTPLKFKTAEEAETYAKNLYEQKQQEKGSFEKNVFLEKETKKDKDDKRLGELIRPAVTEPYRNCKNYTQYDITPEELLSLLGVRGIEFGKWLSPEERKGNINEVHAAFVDLCAILKLPLKAASLNGELALAFGSRGIPSAAAHYESDKKVFNLTRFAGAGSTAHEWMHAVDYILGRHLYSNSTLTSSYKLHNGIKEMEKLRSRSFTKEECEKKLEELFYKVLLLASQILSYDLDRNFSKMIAFGNNEETLVDRYDRFKTNVEEIIERYKKFPPDQLAFPSFSKDVENLYSHENIGFYKTIDKFNCFKMNSPNGKKMKTTLGDKFYQAVFECRQINRSLSFLEANGPPPVFPTKFYEDAKTLDDWGGKSKPYWSNEREMFARAGEFYIAKKLEKEGIYSQYLVFGATREAPWTKDKKGNIVLTPEVDLSQVIEKRELKLEELSFFRSGTSPYPKKEEEEYIFQTMEKIWEKLCPALIELTKNKFPDEDCVIPPLPIPIAEKTKILKQ